MIFIPKIHLILSIFFINKCVLFLYVKQYFKIQKHWFYECFICFLASFEGSIYTIFLPHSKSKNHDKTYLFLYSSINQFICHHTFWQLFNTLLFFDIVWYNSFIIVLLEMGMHFVFRIYYYCHGRCSYILHLQMVRQLF